MKWLPQLSREDAALVIAVVAVLLAVAVGVAVGRRWGRDTAGLTLIALTPLVPTLRIPSGLGLSTDDILPLAGLLVLVVGLFRDRIAPRLWRERPRLERLATRMKSLPPRAWLLGALAIGLGALVLGGTVSAILKEGDRPASAAVLFFRGPGRFLFLGAIVAAVGARLAASPQLARPAITAVAATGTIEAAFGLLAYFAPLPGNLGLSRAPHSVIAGDIPGRIVGTLGISSNFTGAILMVSLIITIGLVFASRDRTRLWWAIAAALQLGALALTYSRVPLAIGVVGVATVIVLARRPIVLVPLALAGAAIVAFTPLAARFLSDSNDRLALWAASFGMMLKHPIAGVGAGRTKRMFELYPDYAHTPFGDATDNAHNTILLAGAEMGILAGIGSLLINIGLAGLAVLLIRDALRGDRRSTVLLAGGVAVLAFLAQGMVNNLFTVGVTGVCLALLSGIFLVNPTVRFAMDLEPDPPPTPVPAT